MYHNFIGIDISKANFTVAQYGNGTTKDFENTPKGFKDFYKEYKISLPNSLVVLETTGGAADEPTWTYSRRRWQALSLSPLRMNLSYSDSK